jgi:hypothetical protein
MADEKKEPVEINEQKKLDEEQKPIVSSDDEMPEPKTKDYNAAAQPSTQQPGVTAYVRVKSEFEDALKNTIGTLGYDRRIGSPEINIPVFQIFEILDKTRGKFLTNLQADELIGMCSKAPYNIIAGVMAKIKADQSEYFEVISPAQLDQLIAAENAKAAEAAKKAEAVAEEVADAAPVPDEKAQ